MKEYNKPRQSNILRPGLYGDDPLATVRFPERSPSTNHLASSDNLTKTTKKWNTTTKTSNT